MSGRAEFQAWLSAAASRRRAAALWGAVALALASFAAAFVLITGADRLMTPSGWPLVVMVAALTMAAAGVTAVVWSRAARRDGPAQMAALADDERPDFQDRAKTAVDLLARHEKGAFDDLVLAETARQVSIVDLPVTTDEAGASRGKRFAAAAAIALAVVLTLAWPTLRDAGTTARVLLFPASLELTVTPGDARVAIGRPFTIGARASIVPRTPGRAMPVLTIVTAASEAAGEMTQDGRAFTYVTPPVTESFTYRVSLGPVTSREYRVEALPFPTVETIDLSYRYPAWSGLPARDEKDGGDVYGPEGTSVRMQVRFDKPAREAALVLGDGTRVPLAIGAEGQMSEASLTLARDNSYRVEITDTDGLTNSESTEYFIRLMDDAPPDVRIVRPAGDQRVTPLAEVAVEARADDDYGVRSLELVYAVRGREERVVPIGGSGARSASGRHLIYLEDLAVAPGDFVSFYARARDVARGKQSTEGRSDIFFLEVKPFEEEFAAAQSMAQAGAGAASRQMQNLAAAQKEIIVATWKLERRSGAGRSASDLRAVAQAQRELRQRTAQAAQRAGAPEGRGGRSGRAAVPPPEPVEAPAEEDPATLLARAGASMELASAALDGGRAKGALEHENAALNDLLKIEAQVRRTEIAQAQSQGVGGGGGGGNQDLSALFDRELQRQQQTNYENRASARANEQQGRQDEESEALRRVREMAQRQEALRREQDALARANVSAEERQRQLERLRRDQEQLQRQVDQLAREMQQQATGQPGRSGQTGQESSPGQAGQPGQPAQGGQSAATGQTGQQGSAGGAGRSAREAAEAMGQAAGSLGREELGQAGEQSARAAESLRDLERELRERGARGQSQAMNDARLEARQIADAQRRLADDAARSGRDGASADAARRIAGEKERIADRLDALGRRAGGNPQAASSARRLAREQRQGAAGWRRAGKAGAAGEAGVAREAGAAGASGAAGEERKMAADLEQLARALGAAPAGPGEDEARQLSNALEEARAARERLADLERQIEELRRDGGNPASARRLQELQGEFGSEAGRAQGLGGGTPEDARSLSRSAPGTEQWKQDFSRWDSMRRGVVQALEAREAALASRLAEQLAAERVHGGYDARTPEAWRRLVAEYYQAIARRRGR